MGKPKCSVILDEVIPMYIKLRWEKTFGRFCHSPIYPEITTRQIKILQYFTSLP